MTFRSILFATDIPLQTEPPACFPDLNLDQVATALTAKRQEYALETFFYTPLRAPEDIAYRHAALRDLEDESLRAALRAFAEGMRRVRRHLAMLENLDFRPNRQGWMLEAALIYTRTACALGEALARRPLRSTAFRGLRAFVQEYLASPSFRALRDEAESVEAALGGVRFDILIRPGRFSVRKYADEAGYNAEIERLFARFHQGEAQNYHPDLPQQRIGMNHIEGQILEFVSRLFPEPFAALDAFCRAHAEFVNETLRRFDREVQFYLAYLEFIAPLQREGLPFCYPRVSAAEKETRVQEGFDLALAHVLRTREGSIVRNDFALEGAERVLVVTGPNQGGKTTFARMVGQIHYLAALGLPVPGRQAHLFLPDAIFTHFEQQEDIRTLRGKLQDDLVRIHAILERATPDSLLLLNEIFSSTTLDDALLLSRAVMARISRLDALAVWVTFLDELAAFDEKTVSMVAEADPENPARRTFRVLRRPADGLAYAHAVARKHRLTYEQIRARLRP